MSRGLSLVVMVQTVHLTFLSVFRPNISSQSHTRRHRFTEIESGSSACASVLIPTSSVAKTTPEPPSLPSLTHPQDRTVVRRSPARHIGRQQDPVGASSSVFPFALIALCGDGDW
ncbi:hypothetical protein CI109_101996 [Kwoniella shandongensis]|uniref:Secreted protein n=1 Tax=Kwoniella shandongensis TaxID=1734106 RepID=A0AAJ8MU27_9TREE